MLQPSTEDNRKGCFPDKPYTTPIIYTLHFGEEEASFIPIGVFQQLMARLCALHDWCKKKISHDFVSLVFKEGDENLETAVTLFTKENMIILNANYEDKDDFKAFVQIQEQVCKCLKSIIQLYHKRLQIKINVDPCKKGIPPDYPHVQQCLAPVYGQKQQGLVKNATCQNKIHNHEKTVKKEAFKVWFPEEHAPRGEKLLIHRFHKI